MARRRFHVPPDAIREGIALLSREQAHHLRDVLRLRAGEFVEIFDGSGNGYTGAVEFPGGEVRICGLQPLPAPESSHRLILAAALIRPAKFEWVLQKATELGVAAIVPLKTLRSEIKIPDPRLPGRMDRWDRIVREASKQCGRMAAPRIHPPHDFREFLAVQDFSSCSRILFYEASPKLWTPAETESDTLVVCVGPEGGWEEQEIEMARTAGCGIFSLGPWTLRAETAAVAAVSIVQYHLYRK